MANSYSVEDLPLFSPWPARLLGLEPWTARKKTADELTREYDREKWGPLLARLRESDKATVDDVDEWFLAGAPETLCTTADRFELLGSVSAKTRLVDLIATTLEARLPAPALVELGAGYGSIILSLAQRARFRVPMWAGEFTESGVEILERLARAQEVELHAGRCDLASPHIADWRPPPRAIVFTSYAITCVRQIGTSFVDSLLGWKPRVVVHFEPCYEHFSANSLLGLMRKRYTELNDYNVNLVSLLHQQQDRGRIRILEERPNVFGANALLPMSIISWEPVLT